MLGGLTSPIVAESLFLTLPQVLSFAAQNPLVPVDLLRTAVPPNGKDDARLQFTIKAQSCSFE